MSEYPYKVMVYAPENLGLAPACVARCVCLEDALAVAIRYEGSIVRNPLAEIGEPLIWDRFGTVAETRWGA